MDGKETTKDLMNPRVDPLAIVLPPRTRYSATGTETDTSAKDDDALPEDDDESPTDTPLHDDAPLADDFSTDGHSRTSLQRNLDISLATDGGQAVSPIGTHYTLEKRGSSWYFPLQSSSPSLSKAPTSSARPLPLPAGSKNKGPTDNELRHKAPSAAQSKPTDNKLRRTVPAAAQSKRTDNGYSSGKPNRAAIGTTDLRSNTVNNDRSVCANW
jgi:hypothetical protein